MCCIHLQGNLLDEIEFSVEMSVERIDIGYGRKRETTKY